MDCILEKGLGLYGCMTLTICILSQGSSRVDLWLPLSQLF